jgi:glucokinase
MQATGRAIGVDIGGTKIAVAAVDGAGRLHARRALATEAERGFARAVDRLSEAIEDVWREAGWAPDGVEGVGIGCAGPVDPRRGLINNPFTLSGWDRCDIVTPLRERFHVPVYLENDADAAALGECLAGAGRGVDPVVMLTFGTGVGGAAILGGHVHRGVQGEHPELGHLVVAPEGPSCYCGARGCLESLASGAALGAAGGELGLADARAVFAAADRGDRAAGTIVERAVQAGASAAWTIFHTLLPQRLILGGGIMDDQFSRFAAAMNLRLAGATQFSRGAVDIRGAELGNDAGLVGAASVVFLARGASSANS